jgi:hypothetical protein
VEKPTNLSSSVIWRGYIIAFFSLVWIANIYMGLFALIRIYLKKERKQTENMEKDP